MSHLNDTDGELHRFRKRIMALAVFVLFCFFLLLLRFVWLQIVRHSFKTGPSHFYIRPAYSSNSSMPSLCGESAPTILKTINKN